MRRLVLAVCMLIALYNAVNIGASSTSSPGGAVVLSIVLIVVFGATVLLVLGLAFITYDWVKGKTSGWGEDYF